MTHSAVWGKREGSYFWDPGLTLTRAIGREVTNQIHVAIAYFDGSIREKLTLAWPRDTEPILDTESSAVGRTHDELLARFEKAVGSPVERGAEVWAAIQISDDRCAPADEKDRCAGCGQGPEFSPLTIVVVCELVEGTEPDRRERFG